MDAKKDFPCLNQKMNGLSPVYLDSACMSLKPQCVIDKMIEYYAQYSGCGGRSAHKFSFRTTDEVTKARENIAVFIGAKKPEQVIFTKNTTESINLVAKSFKFKPTDIVLTTDKEHNSNLVPWMLMDKSNAVKHKTIASKQDGSFDIELFKEMMEKEKNIKMVALNHVSNIDGYKNPIKDIVEIAHDNNAVVLLDGAQSVPHTKIDVERMDIDFLAFSGHKMCGPTGTGVLYGKEELLNELNPFIVGGDTVETVDGDRITFLGIPEKFEAGLQDYAGIIGFGEAARYLSNIGIEKIEKYVNDLNIYLDEKMKSIENVKIIGPADPKKRSGITNAIIDNINSHEIAMYLDEVKNVMVRDGAHCVHSWYNKTKTRASLRASLYLYNDKSDIDAYVDGLKEYIGLVKQENNFAN
ncbi:MAG: cysteine desulfurase [Candidatus Nanohalarchaeota archaeon]|nr:MAG: cysteine desulfurase [Candidatus Nanohaloarchaeota archaeon]